MALRNAVGGAYAAASVVNDGGTVVKGGNIASDSPMTNGLGLNTLADDFGTSFGSEVVAQADTGDKAGVDKAVSGRSSHSKWSKNIVTWKAVQRVDETRKVVQRNEFKAS